MHAQSTTAPPRDRFAAVPEHDLEQNLRFPCFAQSVIAMSVPHNSHGRISGFFLWKNSTRQETEHVWRFIASAAPTITRFLPQNAQTTVRHARQSFALPGCAGRSAAHLMQFLFSGRGAPTEPELRQAPSAGAAPRLASMMDAGLRPALRLSNRSRTRICHETQVPSGR